MHFNLGNSMPFLIAWIICAILVIRRYFKMSKESRKEAISDFKSPKFIFSVGFVIFGWLLTTISQMFTLEILEVLGLVIFVIGGVVSALQNWKTSKQKTFGVLILVAIAVAIIS